MPPLASCLGQQQLLRPNVLTPYDGLFLLLVLAQAFFGKMKINKKLNDVSRVKTLTHTKHINTQAHAQRKRTHTHTQTEHAVYVQDERLVNPLLLGPRHEDVAREPAQKSFS